MPPTDFNLCLIKKKKTADCMALGQILVDASMNIKYVFFFWDSLSFIYKGSLIY